jgi:hypothetical protein
MATFLTIPREIRDKIYELYIEGAVNRELRRRWERGLKQFVCSFGYSWSKAGHAGSLVRVNRQIYAELQPLVLRRCDGLILELGRRVELGDPDYDILRSKLPDGVFSRIHHLTVARSGLWPETRYQRLVSLLPHLMSVTSLHTGFLSIDEVVLEPSRHEPNWRDHEVKGFLRLLRRKPVQRKILAKASGTFAADWFRLESLGKPLPYKLTIQYDVMWLVGYNDSIWVGSQRGTQTLIVR